MDNIELYQQARNKTRPCSLCNGSGRYYTGHMLKPVNDSVCCPGCGGFGRVKKEDQ